MAPAPSGSTGGVAAAGYTGVTAATLYTPELGYGFSKALSSRNRGPAGSVVMQDDMVLGGSGDTYTFSADVPNGDYKVTLYTGDLLETTSTYKTKFAIEGVAKGTVNSRRAVETATYTASVQATEYTGTGVTVGAGYDYYVASFNAGGVRSPLAGPITVAQIPAPQPPSVRRFRRCSRRPRRPGNTWR